MYSVKTILGGCAVAAAGLALNLPLQARDVAAPAPEAPQAKPVEAKPAEAKVGAPVAPKPVVKRPLIQIAILLDTSNSMDGLINQTKTHLWKIVNEFVSARQNGVRPELKVALYEYGNNRLAQGEGFIRKVVPFTDDLDKVSQELFALKTNGGKEYCGQVIQQAVQALQWSKSNKDFKAIFIAGNEPFTQGSVPYADACKEAITKGIVINTIFCGNETSGVNGKWKDGSVLADGSFINIDQNQRVVHIKAPQDKQISELNSKLNKTYVGYGAKGKAGVENQVAQDSNAKKLSGVVLAQRAATKSSAFYSNAAWDLCDAYTQKKIKIEDVKEDQLPENMRKMTMKERKEYIETMVKTRKDIQDKIKEASAARGRYIAAERKKQAEAEGQTSLDDAITKTVREQAEKKEFKFAK